MLRRRDTHNRTGRISPTGQKKEGRTEVEIAQRRSFFLCTARSSPASDVFSFGSGREEHFQLDQVRDSAAGLAIVRDDIAGKSVTAEICTVDLDGDEVGLIAEARVDFAERRQRAVSVASRDD